MKNFRLSYKVFKTAVLTAIVAAGLIEPIYYTAGARVDNVFVILSFILPAIPSTLLPISIYVGMTKGYMSKAALVLETTTLLSIVANLCLGAFVPIQWYLGES